MKSSRLRESLFGKALDPFSQDTRHSVALVAFLAWIGLGADGLSSACYGPEEAYLALGAHTPLGLYLAALTAATVFIIAVAYNQVIELFPSGGGGYKVATSLLGPYAGLVSGSALIVDYVLTVSISVASGVDALFSLLSPAVGAAKLSLEIALTLVLLFLNLRGMRESIRLLLPIFLGFVITHTLLIVYGTLAHVERISTLIPQTWDETTTMSRQLGWVGVASLLLRAYSLGGGTYTGIEAVSNNVQALAEPRVRTRKWTMFYMGGLARVHRRRDHPPLPALGRAPRGGTNVERGYVRVDYRELRVAKRCAESNIARGGLGVRGRSSVRGREYGIPRRPGRIGQHGGGLVDAASIPQSFEPPCHSKRADSDGGGGDHRPSHHRRQRRGACRSLQHQRLSYLHALACRTRPLLVEPPPQGNLARSSVALAARLCRLRWDSRNYNH